jgi:hypothetical protein
MRPLVLQMGVTLDGFVHGAEGYEDWGLPPEEDELAAWKAGSLRQAGAHIMGRALRVRKWRRCGPQPQVSTRT